LPLWIDEYKQARLDNASYELYLDNEVYLTDSSSGKKEKLDDKNSQIFIKSGQFALLVTEETIKIPTNV
jgi:dCTP deaminase